MTFVFTATRGDAGTIYNTAVMESTVLRLDEPQALRPEAEEGK